MNAPENSPSENVRRIIHVDMDAFFASVEQRDFSEYQGKPLIVGGQPDSRGVVAACSYEARQFGIRSAMSCAKAYRLCPQAIFVSPRFEVYREASNHIRQVFATYTPLIEPLSLDEAYLDVTNVYQQYGSATELALIIRKQIKAELNLNASAGISYNKFLAKIASDMNKPNGQFVVRPEQALDFIASLPIGRFFGVGRVTEQKMKKVGIHTGADLQTKTLDELEHDFGNRGDYYYRLARGIDERSVVNHRERKSVGKESTYAEDLLELDAITNRVLGLSERVYALLEKRELTPKTITLKVRYSNFKTITRSQTLPEGYTNAEVFSQMANALLNNTDCGIKPVRLLGVSASNFLKINEGNIEEHSEASITTINEIKKQQMSLF